MKTKKTPAPLRAGTARAKKLTQKILRDLGDDREALEAVLSVVRLLARRSPIPRR